MYLINYKICVDTKLFILSSFKSYIKKHEQIYTFLQYINKLESHHLELFKFLKILLLDDYFY